MTRAAPERGRPTDRPERDGVATAALDTFRRRYPFPLDPFQEHACAALARGRGVLVAAPTGAGKTVVGEFACHLALEQGVKCFYTTPIKALSNQKYADLTARHGPAAVGLLTGDTSRNGGAPLVVMTTEVLRNMLYERSAALRGLGYVVMDEVHYLADPFRGAAWEEVILHLPAEVRLVSLSATVSNAEEFGDWLGAVRGATEVIVAERRPVPLFQHVLAGRRLYDLFADTGRPDEPVKINPELVRAVAEDARLHALQTARGWDRSVPRTPAGRRDGPAGARPARSRALGPGGLLYTPGRAEVADRLERAGLLPAIVFVFSRQGCDAAVETCRRSGVRLTTAAERREIRAVLRERCAELPAEDLAVLGYDAWCDALSRGVAAHHAGLLPLFKECVEELFGRALIKVVFATETLALGINMPARSVVLERLVKWNGQEHADVTPGEYTQLTGRAGRRGIDVEGHAVVLWQPGLDAESLGGLASTRTYPLRSSFAPSYNMAVNLVGRMGRERARAVLESSFAQYQADRAVVALSRAVERGEETIARLRDQARCERGDVEEYAELVRELGDETARAARRHHADIRAAVLRSFAGLRAGDVLRLPGSRHGALAVVVDPGSDRAQEMPRPTVLTSRRRLARLSVADLPAPVEVVSRMRIPAAFRPRDARDRRDLASSLLRHVAGRDLAGIPPAEPAELPDGDALRAAVTAHPCHRCPDREAHLTAVRRRQRLEREIAALRHRRDRRTDVLGRQFDRVCEVLDELGYLAGDRVTGDGERLRHLYTELDLLAAECLRRDLWAGLDVPALAACLSCLVFESRQPDDATPPRLPAGPARGALAELAHLSGRLDDVERAHAVALLREPDLGFAWAAHRWAAGATLEEVLTEAELSAGDFVRWARQLVDLAGQVGEAAGAGRLRDTCAAVVAAVRRGVVAELPAAARSAAAPATGSAAERPRAE